MFTVDEVVKLLLAGSTAFAIAGIAFQLMRMIGATTSSIQDFRKTIQNLSKASDMVLEDYSRIRKLITGFLDGFESFKANILEPFSAFLPFLKTFTGSASKKEEEDEE